MRKKLVIVGDGACGKTSLLTTFSRGFFPTEYVPTVFENSVVTVKVDDVPVELELWDTAGQEDFDQLRPFSYLDADVVLLAFSVENIHSLESAQSKWVAEVLRHCPDVPIILVGMKTDLRDDKSVTREMSQTVAVNMTAMYLSHSHIDRRRKPRRNNNGPPQQLGAASNAYIFPYLYAIKYVECSSKLNDGVNEVFEHATRAAQAYGTVKLAKKKRGTCVLL